MIPILFDSSETTFTSNGLGRLAEATRCEVTEERNGIYELQMEYPVRGKLIASIQVGAYIFATHDDGKVPQAFQIYQVSAPLEGFVTINAWHISYALNSIIVAPFTAASCSAAVAAIAPNSINTNPFTFWTNKSVTADFELSIPTAARALLGGTAGSILDVYGTGEYEFDMFTVKLHQNRGSNRGVSIRYGKNLTKLDRTLDGSTVYNSVVPYWTGEDQTVYSNTLVTRTGETPGRAIALDMSADFETAPTVLELQTAAQSYIDASNAYQIKDNIKIDFVALWQTTEYASYAALQRVYLCDTVNIFYEKAGINATAKCIKVVYDTLRERYSSIELGDPQTTLAKQIEQDISGTVLSKVPSTSMMENAIDRATQLITGGYGGYIKYTYLSDGTPSEILVMDTADASTAVHVIRINQNGIGFSSTGVNGPYTSAWTIDGSFVADFITAGTLSADRIAAGSLAIGKLDASAQTDIATGVAAHTEAENAQSAAEAAQSTADGANAMEQLIYISKASGTSSMAKNTTWVSNTTGNQNTWTTKRPVYNSNYPVLFVATQRQSVDGTVTCTTPVIDQTTTVIDGGNIITGSIMANKIAAGSLTIGNFDASVQQQLNNADEALSTANANATELDNLTGYIVADNGVLALGKVGNEFTAELDNTRLAFKQGDTAVAYLSNSRLYITEAEILTNLQIGHYQWITDSTGRMSLKWVN